MPKTKPNKSKSPRPREKLKILAAGDIHGDMTQAERLAERAKKENVDLVILCGDLTMFEESTKNIIGPFKKRNEKVLLIPGNHETVATADFLAELYAVKNIHGYSVKYKDVGIFGAGGANIGLFQMDEKEIYDLLKKGNDKIEYLKKKIMVTHVHPSETKMEKFTQILPGSPGVRKAVKKFSPDILLCSHVHEAEGIEEKIGKTRVINVGKKGKIFEI
ncbi:MAG: metallophosphoesterase [Candidatus Woesearchaeota archaeon]|jgi:Icc-related predicted phosphoesterase|nr:metallophosphoesterase [Candidatus Woesearchaeota archaeon]MDP7323296.1 metallophosphoesterase [Candidatus Woesearchaeota archaeon]MDP7457715.1 metallophosphoesterase [Candidatus Woesearchaeota archaeon]